MGSSGYGNFGNYGKGSNGGGNTTIGSGGINGLEQPEKLDNINLEDVATSDYYSNHVSVPDKGAVVVVPAQLINGRIVVILKSTSEVIGNIPTEFNYLYTHIKSGSVLKGHVISSGIIPVPYVVVTLSEK
ncbi:MAG: hypothetical protein ACYC5K_12490 [Saccharofermentanales bacterium]